MFIIGIDPHKGSHTAAAVDRHKVVIDTIRVDADRHQRARLLAWAAQFEPRSWAVEGATGMGALLAQQLVAAGEHVVDVPPKLSSRARLLESGRSDKTDPDDARSAAIVAWHNPVLNVVAGLDEHRVVLRLLADRDHQITAQRTRTIGRLHALLCLLIEGGTTRALTASKANDLLHLVAIDGPITAERVATARQFVTEIASLDQARIDTRKRAAQVITATATSGTPADPGGSAPMLPIDFGSYRRQTGASSLHRDPCPAEARFGSLKFSLNV